MPKDLASHSATLAENLDRCVKPYSLAAVAAGVSLLALAQPARGEVVITRKTIAIEQDVYPPFQIDLNHDGIADFSVHLNFSAYPLSDWDLFVVPAQGWSVGAIVTSNKYPAALAAGAKIGPSAQFGSSSRVEHVHSIDDTYSHRYARILKGNWGNNPRSRYLGVRFLINGKTHYGWIRMAVITQPRGMSATITEYAYETVANKKISAGATQGTAHQAQVEIQAQKPAIASLGMLALGADGLAIWRREEDLSS